MLLIFHTKTFRMRLSQLRFLLFLGVFAIQTPVDAQKLNPALLWEITKQTVSERVKVDPELYQEIYELDPNFRSTPSFSNWVMNNAGEINISSTEDPESEVHAAINPLDANNIIASAIQWKQGALLPELKVPVYYTRDFGATWQQSTFDIGERLPFTTFVAGGGDPIIVFDNKGTAYFSWLTLTLDILTQETLMKLHWAVSEDGGETWEESPTLLDLGEIEGSLIDQSNLKGRLVDKQWMASDLNNGNLYAAYVEIGVEDSVTVNYRIMTKTKHPDSLNFGPAVTVNSPEIAFAQFSSIDVASDGSVHVTFAGIPAVDSVMYIYHAMSKDEGKTYTAPQAISPVHIPCFPPGFSSGCNIVGIDSSRMYPSPHVKVDRSGGEYDGNVYAIWAGDGYQTKVTEGVDIFFARSLDGGTTWTAPIILNNDENPDLHQFHPSIYVNDVGTLIVTWYDRREDPNNVLTKYYMTYSTDGGETFVDDFPVSAEASDFSEIGSGNANFGIGEYTQVIATSEVAIPFWADGRENNGNIDIYSANISLVNENSTSVESVQKIQAALTIDLLTPNPAKDKAMLTLDLKRGSEIQASLTAIDGQRVSNLFTQTLTPGVHQFNIDVTNLPNGIYVLQVNGAIGKDQRKLVVNR